MIRLTYSKRALRDIDEACEWTRWELSVRQGDALSDTLRRAIGGLTLFPDRGRPGQVAGTRELIVGRVPFFIVYRSLPGEVRVLAILHQARAWPPR